MQIASNIVCTYSMYVVWKEVKDMEEVLAKAGIVVYAKYICGYHIHGEAASHIDTGIDALEYSYIRRFFCIVYRIYFRNIGP